MHANADEFIAFPDPNLEAAVHRAIDKPAGFFARHLPDSHNGQVMLASLDPATIPPEVQGVWRYDALAGNYNLGVWHTRCLSAAPARGKSRFHEAPDLSTKAGKR